MKPTPGNSSPLCHAADTATTTTNQLVVNAVKGDPTHGEDRDLYEAMGYVRKSARKSGLTRKTSTAAQAAVKK